MKRGFKTKKEALTWEQDFLNRTASDISITFASFVEIYVNDMRVRLREHTWQTKESIIRTKLLPFFGMKKMNEIKTTDIIAWQNALISHRNAKGSTYSDTYLKTIHNQLNAIFNHAVRYYELKSNPITKAGSIGRSEAKEVLFWTKDEYLRFSEGIKEQTLHYCAFELMYWCGLRVGELLALTAADFNITKQTLTVNKSYQRIKSRDVITEPKTPKSNRIIKMPDFLCAELTKLIKGAEPERRIFVMQKYHLYTAMNRVCKRTGIKRIRVHGLRHSHVSLLVDMGFSAPAIADRVGHESIGVTYRYAHLFPSIQSEMADKLHCERNAASA
jgi:integrase